MRGRFSDIVEALHTWVGVGLVLACAVVSAGANGLRNPPEGGAALGHPGGKIAYTEDATAITHNPANLVDLSGSSGQFNVLMVHGKTEYDGPLGRSGETKDNLKFIPSLYAVIDPGEDSNFMTGVAVHSPFGQSTTWEKAGPFLGSAPYFAELITLNINPTVAMRLTDRVAVGAGVNLMWSDLDLRLLLPLAPAGPPTRLKVQGDGVGYGANAGVTVQVTDNQRLAVTYRSQISVDYEGDTDVSNPRGPFMRNSDFNSEIDFPTIVGLGYGIEVTERLRLTADAEWVDFSQIESLPLDLGANSAAAAAIGLPPEFPEDWEDVWTFGLGADYTCSDNWILRGGWQYLESPVPERTLAPTLPDADRHVVSAGVGYRHGRHALDAGYALSVYEADVSGNLNPAFNGTYDTVSHLLQFSYGMSF